MIRSLALDVTDERLRKDYGYTKELLLLITCSCSFNKQVCITSITGISISD